MEEEEKMKGKRKCLSRAAVIIVTARMPLKCFCRLDCTSSQWNGKKEKGKKYNLTAEAKENEGAEEKGNLLWLQWSPSNPGWHWHFPRTQAPCPWHPFTQPSVNSCKSWQRWHGMKSVKGSPESFEARAPHCARPRRRCTPRRTSGPPPWRSSGDDGPASATDDSWFGIEKENFPSFFIWKFWKVWNWVSHALMYSVFKSFQSWHTLLGIIFSQKLSWNPFKRVKTSWWCSTI